MELILKEEDNPHCMQCIKEQHPKGGFVIKMKGIIDLSGYCDKHADPNPPYLVVGNVFDGTAIVEGFSGKDQKWKFKDE